MTCSRDERPTYTHRDPETFMAEPALQRATVYGLPAAHDMDGMSFGWMLCGAWMELGMLRESLANLCWHTDCPYCRERAEFATEEEADKHLLAHDLSCPQSPLAKVRQERDEALEALKQARESLLAACQERDLAQERANDNFQQFHRVQGERDAAMKRELEVSIALEEMRSQRDEMRRERDVATGLADSADVLEKERDEARQEAERWKLAAESYHEAALGQQEAFAGRAQGLALGLERRINANMVEAFQALEDLVLEQDRALSKAQARILRLKMELRGKP